MHRIRQEYRAAATLDREHDEADRASGRRIGCPILALWSDRGALATWHAEAGGRLALWRRWGTTCEDMPSGPATSFRKSCPMTAQALERFFLDAW